MVPPFLNGILKKHWAVLGLFAALVHLLYARTRQAGFVTDFTGLMQRLDGAPFSGVWDCFGFPAMHQLTNFFLFFFAKWFGVGGIGWYLVFTSLHVANGFLGYLLARKLFERNGHGQPETTAFMASLLFLLSPYQAEVLVWRVCFNFLFCSLAMLGSLLFLLKYLEQRRWRQLLLSHLFFVVALFTFELALALPLLAASLLFFFGRKRQATIVLLPQIALTAGYFLLNKLVLGGWAGHYGEAVHLNPDVRLIAANCLKYFTKYLLWWREWPHGGKEWLVLFLERPVVALSGLAVGLASLSYLLSFKKAPVRLRLPGLALLLFFFAIAPVANLYVAYILHGENDPYGYLASLFFGIGLVALLDALPRWLRNGLYMAWLVASLFFLQKMTVRWQEGDRIFKGLLHDFRWHDAPEVYVLACPDNYQGIPVFKDFTHQDLALKDALRYVAAKPATGNFYQVAQFNLTAPTDRFSARRDSTAGHFHLQFGQWGNWWWLHGMGLGDYQTEQYRFRTDGNGCRVEMKQWPPRQGAVFIVAQGEEWEQL